MAARLPQARLLLLCIAAFIAVAHAAADSQQSRAGAASMRQLLDSTATAARRLLGVDAAQQWSDNWSSGRNRWNNWNNGWNSGWGWARMPNAPNIPPDSRFDNSWDNSWW